MRRATLSLGGLAAVCAALVACDNPDACGDGRCVDALDGGREAGVEGGSDAAVDGGVDAQPDVQGCEATKGPSEDPCVITEAVGVFVDANQSAGGDGSKSHPFNTIGAAVAAAGGKRVYVCEGRYEESVSLTSAVSVYGGLRCGDWAYTGSKAKVAPSVEGYALKVEGVTSAMVIADLEFEAKDGSAGASSIAAFVNASPGLVLQGVKLVAGAGGKGEDRTQAAPAARAKDGNAGSEDAGGPAQACACSAVNVSGGKGGDPPSNAGTAGAPVGAGGGVLGAADGDCGSRGAGGIGGKGTAGTDGGNAPQPTTLGALDIAGWHPKNGAAGDPGTPGGGGGGGGSRGGGGAGGGGCGGCGGAGGQGGMAGGASIALVAVGGTIKVISSSLVATTGGAGGKGAAGQVGQQGGYGQLGSVPNPPGCSGGDGANGGNGGAGSGGAGGLSIGILYSGAKPDLGTPATTTITRAATGGTAGAGGVGGNSGKPGVAADVQDVGGL